MTSLRNQLDIILQKCWYEYSDQRTIDISAMYPIKTIHINGDSSIDARDSQTGFTQENTKKCSQFSYVRDGNPHAPFLSSVKFEIYES